MHARVSGDRRTAADAMPAARTCGCGQRATLAGRCAACAGTALRSRSSDHLRDERAAAPSLARGHEFGRLRIYDEDPAPADPGTAPVEMNLDAAPLPRVSLGNFKNSGNTDSENNCPLCPKALGVPDSDGANHMEIRGDITGHVATAQYDIKRTKERGTWKKVGSTWTQLSHVGPGADDDSHNDDEDLTPQNSHIFVIDGPGWPGAITNPTGDTAATEAVYKASFVETCNVKVGSGSWTQSSNSVQWHSISWLAKKADGSWGRKAGSSEIATGSITIGTGDP